MDKEIIKNDPELQNSLQCIENPIAPQRLRKLQQQDTYIEILKCKLQNNRLDKEYYSLDENELLTRKVIDGGYKFCAIYLHSILIFQVLQTAHDDLGHNGFPRTYAKANLDHIYSNGTEFKNKLFKEVIEKLGTEFSIHSPPYRPQSDGKIEGFHRFLKTCISKHINYGLEWDELTPMATACYNFFPNCNARESAFFVMFGRDPINKLNMSLHSARRYFHDDNGLPNLEALKNIYQVVAQQLLNSRERYVKKHHDQQ